MFTNFFAMEKKLESILDDLIETEGISGCIVSDKQGLCLGVRGNASTDSSGILTAISDQARKIEPASDITPVVVLENGRKQCIIKSNDKLMLCVYKDKLT